MKYNYYKNKNMNLIAVAIAKMIKSCDNNEIKNFNIVLTDPKNSIINLETYKMDMKKLSALLLWYFSGSNKTDIIKNYFPKKNSFNNLGYYTFYNYNQFNICRTLLENSGYLYKNSLILFYIPGDQFTLRHESAIYMHFYINNNYLNCYVSSLRYEFVEEFIYDLNFFTILQRMLFILLKKNYSKLKLGLYHHHIYYLYVTKKNKRLINKISKDIVKKVNPYFLTVDEGLISDLTNNTYKSSLLQTLYKNSIYPKQKFRILYK